MLKLAKLDLQLNGDFDQILVDLDKVILSESMSAHLEGSSDFHLADTRCSVRVYERYSYLGQNRVSMNITLFQSHEEILLSIISSGGSQAVFFKINTFGEEYFLDTIRPLLKKYDAVEIN